MPRTGDVQAERAERDRRKLLKLLQRRKASHTLSVAERQAQLEHLLAECPAYASTRRRLWGGPLPSLEEVLSGPTGKIVEYIRRVGRSEPPLDQPTPDAPAGASA